MTDFVNVSWSDEEITDEKLNQMAENEKYLLERIMPHQYQAYGITKTSGLKFACGIASLPASPSRQIYTVISFGRFFTPGSRPIVMGSVASPNNFRIFTTIKGNGSNNMRPDHNGFTVVLNASPLTATNNHFPAPSHFHWVAIGY